MLSEGNDSLNLRKLRTIVLLRFVVIYAVFGFVLFMPAGTVGYWQAWLYLAILVSGSSAVILFFLKTDPALLERRMRTREKEREQKVIIRIGYVISPFMFLIPGFDQRFQWSDVPLWLVFLSDGFVILGYLLFFWVLRENRFAGRTIEVERDQSVITTGPYAVVRHPMYVATLMIYLFTPLALGSFWALWAVLGFVPVIVARILNEEDVLCRDLSGYTEYVRKTKYRLIPGVW